MSFVRAFPLALSGQNAGAAHGYVNSPARRTRRKREVKKEAKKEKEAPQVISCTLADNEYTGIIKDGPLGVQHLEGSVSYAWTSGIKYEGSMVNSQIEGFGKLSWPDGSTYEGNLHRGMRHGQGVYMAKDGMTRYSGQWQMGKRHGFGVLTFHEDGAASYEGHWQEGKKHGQGKQVWPSGNTYDGEWECGRMSGEGMMTWRHANGQYEQYSGHWQNNVPEGEGTHTWHAPEPKPSQTAKEWPSQQMNNRYSGQWHQGQRHGFGTFYYANGSYYRGEWKEHKKHGTGRHTFEDGRVYVGEFEQDRMIGNVPKDMLLPPLTNFGNEDNPMRRCIDISDLMPFAMPTDQMGFGLSGGVGYRSTEKILREVYNMLLRHLGELKELYFRFRVVNPRPGADPFMLEARQLWTLLRAAGVATPTCPLSKLDRYIFNGPRHHSEVAPDDMADLQPLTPRPRTPSPEPSEQEGDYIEDERLDVWTPPDEMDSRPGSRSSAAGGASEDGSSVVSSSAVSPSVNMRTNSFRNSLANLPETDEMAEAADQSLRGPQWGEVIVSGKFARSLGYDVEPADIHSPERPLMFRHFLESTVRLSMCTFPSERGLEPQLRRFMTEVILPTAEAPAGSPEDLFAFFQDATIAETLKELGPALLQRLPLSGPQPEEEGIELNIPFGIRRRRYLVNARTEHIIRVKDVLRLLRNAGVLKPFLQDDLPQEEERYSSVLKPMAISLEEEGSAKDGGQGGDDEADDTQTEARSSPRLRHSVTERFPPQRFPLQRGYTYTRFSVSRGLGGFDMEGDDDTGTRRGDDETEAGTEAGAGKGDAEQTSVSAANPLSDLSQFDFSLTVQDAISCLCEVLNDQSLEHLRWELERQGQSLQREQLTLLEYMEVELVFPEFIRLLLRMTEMAASLPEAIQASESLSIPTLFDSMLRHIILPSLGWAPGTAPVVVEPEVFAEASLDTAGASSDTPAAQPTNEEEESVQQQLSQEAAPPKPPEQPAALWLGFSDKDVAGSSRMSRRRWPPGYLEALEAWEADQRSSSAQGTELPP